jgi:penicillin-binding protein 1A
MQAATKSRTARSRNGRGNRRRTPRGGAQARRPPLSKKQWALFFAKWGALGGLVMTAVGITVIAILFWHYGADDRLPNITKLDDYRPNQVVRVLSSDGEAVGEIYKERRTFVPYDKLPKHVVNAFIAAEDAGFWEHEGIDYIGMIRALFINIKTGSKKQGASTITQQVVKNLLLSPERTFKRKFQEIILARRLEKHLSKQEIITLYANEIFFGHGRYGIQEAARYYFGKNVEDLDVGEAAMLAGLPKGPNNYSPKKKDNAERAKVRQTYVLTQMVRSGFITQKEGQKWVDEPIAVIGDPYPTLGDAPEWLEVARTDLVDKLGEDEVYKVGGNVVTTLDLEIQRVARAALQAGLRELDERQGYGHPYRPRRVIKADKIDLEALKLSRRLGGGPRAGRVYTAIVREVHPKDGELVVDLGKWVAAIAMDNDNPRYNPDKKKLGERFEVGHTVKVSLPPAGADDVEVKHADRRVVLSEGPEGAVVVIDVNTREVLALVGGYKIDAAQFNRATMARRQAGSTFKPFVYAAAIDSGDFTAASIVNDTPEIFELWRPENYKKGAFEGPVRLRHALAKSINTVAIKVAHDIGPSRIAEVARSMGVESDLPEHLSLALGSGEVTPLELTNAFASFATGGRAQPPSLIKRIGDKVLSPPSSRQAMRPEVAYVALDMMRSVINGGTGGRAARLGMDIGGKTGTSNDARDAWFIGVTPKYAVGVWVGFDDFQRSVGRGEGGSKAALPVFVEIMGKIGKKSLRFSRPPGLVDFRIDKKTGLLAAQGVTEETYNEVFLPGTAPTEFALRPGETDVDSFAIGQYDDGFGDDDDGDEKKEKEKAKEKTP